MNNLIGRVAKWIRNLPDKSILQSGGRNPQTSDIKVSIDTFSHHVHHFQVRPRREDKTISVVRIIRTLLRQIMEL